MNKKLISFLSVLLITLWISNPVFAGNNANSSSTGSNNTSNISQTGDEHDASVIQNGSTNTSDINQSGLNNDATVNQDGGNNTSTINQNFRGSDNIAVVTQDGPPSNGNDNLSTINQVGSLNQAYVDQDDGNISTIQQDGSGSIANVDQTGFSGSDDNISSIVQGDDNEAYVAQSGQLNDSVVEQGHDNFATVIQSGDFNQSTVTQDFDQTATVTQSGDLNTATVNQQDTGAFGQKPVQLTGNRATIDQVGDNNTATVNQDGSVGPGWSYDNDAEISQTGDWNEATVSQDDFNDATVIQSGMGTSADPNVVSINQLSNNDSASASQAGGEGNLITITQDTFTLNVANASQNGSFNTTVINQN